jgi:hypothetical protein
MIPAQLQPVKLGLAIFFAGQEFGDKITMTGRLREASDGALDGEPMILPIPMGGPPDAPRIQLGARDRSLVLQLSAVRLSLEWSKRRPEPVGWGDCRDAFEKTLGGILRVFIGEYARPTRFAYAPQFIYPLGRSANEYLATQFIQPGRVASPPFSCKIGLMDQVQARGRPMHLWTNLASARHQQRMEKDDVLVIQFDLRTANDDARGLGAEEILAILDETDRLMEDRLQTAFIDLFSQGGGA